jgi:hypothetical protein
VQHVRYELVAVLTPDACAQVCDFRAYTGTPLYLINKPDPARTTSETPYFCHSHLVMKINIGAPDAAATAPNLAAFNEEARTGPLPLDLLQARGFKRVYI